MAGHSPLSNGMQAAHKAEDECVIDIDVHAQTQLEDQREYVACLKCTNDCFNSSHSSASLVHSRLPTAPSFMTVVEDLAFSHLEIPQGFADLFLSRCIGQAKLEGSSGWVWYAPVIRRPDDNHRMRALGSPGWDQFVNDHYLQGGDLLVLTYFSIWQLFKVRIFSAAEGVEKSQHCLPSKPHFSSLPHHVNQKPTQGMELEIYDNMVKSLANSQNQVRQNQVPICNIIKERHCHHELQFQEPKSKLSNPKTTISISNGETSTINCCNCKYPKENFMSYNNVKYVKNNLVESNTRSKTTSPISSSELETQGVVIDHNTKALVPFKRESEQLIEEKHLDPLSRYKSSFKYLKNVNTYGYNRHAVSSPAERERVDREARAFCSKNPFTIKSIPASSIYKDRKLMLPKVFTDVYMPKKEAWMTWVDTDGKQWRCAWLPQRRYNTHVSFVSAGWPAFVNAHHLIEHDICIFELLNQDALLFRVHVLKQRPFDGSVPIQPSVYSPPS